MTTAHTATVTTVPGGFLAACSCGWRAAFPSFSEAVALRQAETHSTRHQTPVEAITADELLAEADEHLGARNHADVTTLLRRCGELLAEAHGYPALLAGVAEARNDDATPALAVCDAIRDALHRLAQLAEHAGADPTEYPHAIPIPR